MHQGSGIDPELINILAFLAKDSSEMFVTGNTGMPNADLIGNLREAK